MWNAITHTWDMFLGLWGAFGTAAWGVLLRHAHIAQQRDEPINWRRVLYDAPTVVLMSILGGTGGQWLHQLYQAPEMLSWALAGTLSYLGPTVMDRLIAMFETRYGKRGD